ncbi:MAG: hypothetical protein BroJett040_01950 [Oligoflexia bacterium]|nr:MAG: hypothetical protein BroJett040_01950 [Oligoflexia bacterium]
MKYEKDHFVEIIVSQIFENKRVISAEELIHDCVAEYIYILMRMGNIPQHQLGSLEEFLKEEALEIYRKATYGFSSLKEYRKSKPTSRVKNTSKPK